MREEHGTRLYIGLTRIITAVGIRTSYGTTFGKLCKFDTTANVVANIVASSGHHQKVAITEEI
ncbi:MAG: hypothetical protein ACKVGY_05820, partial [Candidatus Poseidoniales archaeon]